jgi:hypothetical protein
MGQERLAIPPPPSQSIGAHRFSFIVLDVETGGRRRLSRVLVRVVALDEVTRIVLGVEN